jgi:hypothetical protein
MTSHTSDGDDFERLLKIKAMNQARLSRQRNEWRAKYEALSPEERALVDEHFKQTFLDIAAQFGRSRRFVFGSTGTTSPDGEEGR